EAVAGERGVEGGLVARREAAPSGERLVVVRPLPARHLSEAGEVEDAACGVELLQRHRIFRSVGGSPDGVLVYGSARLATDEAGRSAPLWSRGCGFGAQRLHDSLVVPRRAVEPRSDLTAHAAHLALGLVVGEPDGQVVAAGVVALVERGELGG